MSALASVSVDLDSIHHYCRIHGLSESILDQRARHLIYEVALPRFLELFDAAGVRSTLFAIGEDLTLPPARPQLSLAVGAGHEIGNHSFEHDYALSRRSPAEIAEDLRRSQRAIEHATGTRPKGFRAPGYTLSASLYQALEEEGFLYDSSTFPAAPYYFAKAAVMGGLVAVGRKSGAILDTPKVLFAPQKPYRPDPAFPYRRGEGKVLELPISVSPAMGMPFIGTFAARLPWALVKATYRSLRKTPHFNFELHGIDLIGAEDGLPGPLLRAQKDLSILLEQKRSRLKEILSWMRRDFEIVTLLNAAAKINV